MQNLATVLSSVLDFKWFTPEILLSQPVAVVAFSLTCPRLSVTAAGHLPETRATPVDSDQRSAPQRALGLRVTFPQRQDTEPYWSDAEVQLETLPSTAVLSARWVWQCWLSKYDQILDQITLLIKCTNIEKLAVATFRLMSTFKNVVRHRKVVLLHYLENIFLSYENASFMLKASFKHIGWTLNVASTFVTLHACF